MVFSEYKELYSKRDPEKLSVFFIYIIVASKVSLFLFLFFNIIRKRFKIIGNIFYTIYKIKTILRKMTAVQEVIYFIFNLQTTRRSLFSALKHFVQTVTNS